MVKQQQYRIGILTGPVRTQSVYVRCTELSTASACHGPHPAGKLQTAAMAGAEPNPCKETGQTEALEGDGSCIARERVVQAVH